MTHELTQLTPLFAPLETLPGVAGRRKSLFTRLLGNRAVDALLHLPSGVHIHRPIKHMHQATPGEVVIIEAEILEHRSSPRRGVPHKISCHDGQVFFDVVYFNGRAPYFHKILPEKTRRIIVGRAEKYGDRWTIAHPDQVVIPGPAINARQKEIVYPLTTGVTNACVHRVMHSAMNRVVAIPEWIPENLLTQQQWDSWPQTIRQVHQPQNADEINQANKARERLIFDELLSHQLAINIVRKHAQIRLPGQAMAGTGELITKLLSLLPYEPTTAQKQAIHEIFEDMAKPFPMTRLIQGDVGCGKTLVALMAMLRANESGFQATILAPTDILANQHAQTIFPLAADLGIKAEILTGRDKGKRRGEILERLKLGDIDILIGTHAVIEDDVIFNRLGLAVIDEQHRFGVEQRLSLTQKGFNPDILSMTATPIPRTLQLTNFGDMDVSIIGEKPAGRQPVKTIVLPLNRLQEIIDGVGRALDEKAKVFWVCPLVEESEVLDVSAAQERFDHLQKIFGDRVGLVHGRMKPKEKDAIMEQFISGSVDVLIATTVIEVGVNVPAATIMIIEHAERFGLAQLHQLRGRIGRGDRPATCTLLYGPQIGEVGRMRLAAMRETSDGFKIAEADLRLRGSGDILGTRQSGLPGFRLADFISNPDRMGELLAMANKEARRIVTEDPYLKGERGLPLRLLLSIFGKDEAVKYTRS